VYILDFIGAKDDGGGSDNWSYKSYKKSQIVTTNKPTPNFLQVGCPSPNQHVKALKGKHHITSSPGVFQPYG